MARPDESVVHGSKARSTGTLPEPHASLKDPLKVSLKDLPSVDRLLRHASITALVADHGHTLVAGQARILLESVRESLRAPAAQSTPAAGPPTVDQLADQLADRVAQQLMPRMRAVLNLTGTVIHTNLGRAVLPAAALAHLTSTMAGPNNLEFDLDRGARGDRDSIVEGLLCEITGAEAATVVNNNAAAVLLTIAALATGREVVVSRGELVEIGGAFRMPDVMASAGARLVEVGTTNRTHPRDYAEAITDQTALVMKVHTSNYAIEGFTAAVDEATLAPICQAHGVPLATDLGSGSLIDLTRYGLPHEPRPQDMLKAGCDVVTFSGDKLLGGPQAGLIVGRREVIARIRSHPMKRALRMSKLPLAALEATLMLYLRPERLIRDLPTLRWLTRPTDQIRATAEAVCPALAAALSPRYAVAITELGGQIGSGSLPVERLPSVGLMITPSDRKGAGRALNALAEALRALPTPVIGRISDDRLLLDLRCLEDPAPLLAQLPSINDAFARSFKLPTERPLR